jgi:glycosyltransferase involved in cell wall biosynthesis
MNLTFVIPAYNEAEGIGKTIDQVVKSSLIRSVDLFEIVIINDNSSDDTECKISDIKKKFPKLDIVTYKNKHNLGFGGATVKGLKLAKYSNIFWLPGDNSHPSSEIKKILKEGEKYGIVSTYYKNSHERKIGRKLFTSIYTPFLNIIYGLKLPYYNGLSLINKKILDQVDIKTRAHCWQVELWVKARHTKDFKYKFVPTILQDNMHSVNAFKFNNSIKVIYNIFRLFFLNLYLFIKSKFFN